MTTDIEYQEAHKALKRKEAKHKKKLQEQHDEEFPEDILYERKRKNRKLDEDYNHAPQVQP